MRIFSTEFRKLFSSHIFILIISAVLVLNAYLMFKTANSSAVTPSDYKQIYAELEQTKKNLAGLRIRRTISHRNLCIIVKQYQNFITNVMTL